MTECSHELRDAGRVYPRTCALCGLGPCQRERTPPPVRYANAGDLAAHIAEKVYPHIQDRQRRDEIAELLTLFAAEIRRSTIEP